MPGSDYDSFPIYIRALLFFYQGVILGIGMEYTPDRITFPVVARAACNLGKKKCFLQPRSKLQNLLLEFCSIAASSYIVDFAFLIHVQQVLYILHETTPKTRCTRDRSHPHSLQEYDFRRNPSYIGCSNCFAILFSLGMP